MTLAQLWQEERDNRSPVNPSPTLHSRALYLLSEFLRMFNGYHVYLIPTR